MKEAMISTGQAASMLGRDPRTIRRWIADKRLRSHRANGQLRVYLSDVRALAGEADSQRTSTDGLGSLVLKGMQDDVKRLTLEAEKLTAEERIEQIKKRRDEKQAERESAAEEDRQAKAEEHAQATREQEERDRQRRITAWRIQVLEFLARPPDGAPAALRARFYERAGQALGEFDCEQSTCVVQELLAGIQQEVFGPWEQECQAIARAAWIDKQVEEARSILRSACAREGLRVPEENMLHQALHEKILIEMQPFSTAAPWSELRGGRQRAVDALLAPWRAEKALHSVIQGALDGLWPYLRQLREEGFLPVAPQDVNLLAQLLEPKVRRFLSEQGTKRQLTAAEAKELLENFVLEDQKLL